jgi:hypothetical protein
MSRVIKNISLSEEANTIVKKRFPYGEFSKFIEDKIFEYEKSKNIRNPKELTEDDKYKIKIAWNSAVNVMHRTGGNRRFAKYWSQTLTDLGKPVSEDELIALSKGGAEDD